jgi:CHAD domain-containing protein
MLADFQTDDLNTRIKWLTRELAPARELDVFIKGVAKPAASGKPHAPGMVNLTRDLRRRRARAYARAHAAIESAQCRALVLDIAEWIEGGQWVRSADDSRRLLRDRPIAQAAFDELRRRRMGILKKGRHLGDLSTHRRHKLRIQTKKLRYAAEFFTEAFPGKKAARRREQFVSRLEKLQEALGELNDIAVHENLTESVANIHDDNTRRHQARSKKAFAAGRLSGREEARMASVLKSVEKSFRAFAKADPFWT